MKDGCKNPDFGGDDCPNEADLTCILCGVRFCFDCHRDEPCSTCSTPKTEYRLPTTPPP